jgi:DNA-binding MarR family transcriptional regulator
VSGRAELPPGDYTRLLEFRTALRRFIHWSEAEAKAAGLTPAQHQLLLAIRGHPGKSGPTIGELSGYLVLRHHSAVGLIDRASKAGLVRRKGDEQDHRVVRLALTPLGRRRIEMLSQLHLEELRRLGPLLDWIEGDPTELGGAPN